MNKRPQPATSTDTDSVRVSAAEQIEAMFLAIVELPADARAAAIERACGGVSDIRERLQSLLRAHEEEDSLLDESIGYLVRQAMPTDIADPTRLSDPDEAFATVHEALRDGDHAQDPSSSRPADELISERYRLERRIGEGGMGEVWLATQTTPIKRRVALKLVKAGRDTKDVLSRFEQERQALAMMDHPNISRVLDGGVTTSGAPFFVMELVDGIPLTRYCEENRLSLAERLQLFLPICFAVQHAHQKGVIHRDLKPNNILVTKVDGKPVPKIIDFGNCQSHRWAIS